MRSLFSRRRTHRLRFTGSCSEDEFRARCEEHDFWYHSFYFDNGFEQRGDYDIGRDIEDYGFPESMEGMRVLDVGTGSGWFAAYFEQKGASVTTTDIRGHCDFDEWGRPFYTDVRSEKPSPDRVLPDGRAVYYSPVSKGFWIMKDILGLRADYINARVYELRPELFGGQTFDLVFMGSLLMHVRDPVGALMAARTVCHDRFVATSLKPAPEADLASPRMEFLNDPYSAINWWRPNSGGLIEMARSAGFSEAAIGGTVQLSTDRPFRDSGGRVSGEPQQHHRLDARVEPPSGAAGTGAGESPI